jgi:hypothetical protein
MNILLHLLPTNSQGSIPVSSSFILGHLRKRRKERHLLRELPLEHRPAQLITQVEQWTEANPSQPIPLQILPWPAAFLRRFGALSSKFTIESVNATVYFMLCNMKADVVAPTASVTGGPSLGILLEITLRITLLGGTCDQFLCSLEFRSHCSSPDGHIDQPCYNCCSLRWLTLSKAAMTESLISWGKATRWQYSVAFPSCQLKTYSTFKRNLFDWKPS